MATAWGAVPQPRLRPRQVFIAGITGEVQTCVFLLPHHGTALTLRGNFSMKIWTSQIEAASPRSYGAGQRTGINYQLHMGRYNSPIQVVQKQGHESTISKRHQVGRQGLYSGHYSGVFVAAMNAQNAETKHQSGAVPNPTTSLIGFND